MAQARYEYGTSPRKIEPEFEKKSKGKLKVVKNNPYKKNIISKEQRIKHFKMTFVSTMIILLLLTITCRNSQIDNQFAEIQKQKQELSSIQKENEQLKVSIENSLNLSNIEKVAKEELGMQKLSSKQIVYVTLPKKDYVESKSEKIEKDEKKQNIWEKVANKIKQFIK